MRFEYKVRAILNVCPGRKTSGLRSREHNKRVGGVFASTHLLDLAKDIVLDDKRKDGKLFKALCNRMKLVCIDEGDHFHVHEPNP